MYLYRSCFYPPGHNTPSPEKCDQSFARQPHRTVEQCSRAQCPSATEFRASPTPKRPPSSDPTEFASVQPLKSKQIFHFSISSVVSHRLPRPFVPSLIHNAVGPKIID